MANIMENRIELFYLYMNIGHVAICHSQLMSSTYSKFWYFLDQQEERRAAKMEVRLK